MNIHAVWKEILSKHFIVINNLYRTQNQVIAAWKHKEHHHETQLQILMKKDLLDTEICNCKKEGSMSLPRKLLNEQRPLQNCHNHDSYDTKNILKRLQIISKNAIETTRNVFRTQSPSLARSKVIFK